MAARHGRTGREPIGTEDHAGLSRYLDARPASGPGGERPRILLADDNADMRELRLPPALRAL